MLDRFRAPCHVRGIVFSQEYLAVMNAHPSAQVDAFCPREIGQTVVIRQRKPDGVERAIEEHQKAVGLVDLLPPAWRQKIPCHPLVRVDEIPAARRSPHYFFKGERPPPPPAPAALP